MPPFLECVLCTIMFMENIGQDFTLITFIHLRVHVYVYACANVSMSEAEHATCMYESQRPHGEIHSHFPPCGFLVGGHQAYSQLTILLGQITGPPCLFLKSFI